MIWEILLPTIAMALTSGPAQPEFSTFDPVGGSDLVNMFTGEFGYNIPVISIPGPNGMGYALALSYHSGSSIEDEASWVGYGWSLNAGAINRMKRGFPDDVKNGTVEYWNNIRPNWTATATKRLGLEYYSVEKVNTPLNPDPEITAESWAELNGQLTHRYNNYKGYGYSRGLTAGVTGIGNVGIHETDGLSHYSYSINPAKILQKTDKGFDEGMKFDKQASWAKNASASMARGLSSSAFTQTQSSTGLFGMFNFNDWSMPYSTTKYSGWALELSGAVEGDFIPFPIGIEGGFKGTFATQATPSSENRSVYGYLYTADAGTNEAMMDYYTEKEGGYQKRDQFLPIPFSNADHYIVSGQSLSGSFRAYHTEPGTFRPNAVSSTTYTAHGNLDVHLGATGGLGVDGGFGIQTLSVEPWMHDHFAFPKLGEKDEPFFFRFTDDLGGSVEFADNDNPVRAEVDLNLLGEASTLTVDGVYRRINQQGAGASINPGGRSGRSAYIGYRTNAEMMDRPPMTCFDNGGPVLYRRHSKRMIDNENVGPGQSDAALNRSEAGIADGVGEFAVSKENGTKYVYGLPVYSRQESNMQYGVQGIRASNIENNYLAYRYIPTAKNDLYSIIGEKSDQPYATTHLLTEILSPEYVDRKNDGPTADDLGGYVRFKYKRTAGSRSKMGLTDTWYRWRSPYRGLYYQRNSLSDPYDDAGTVSSGYKEIYYLSTIETKTHIARFHTESRKDGYEAVHSEREAASSSQATSADEGNNKMHKLNKIELYSKNSDGAEGKLLVTVNFEYDYSMCTNTPNAESGNGRLTLKRLWFEYEGVHSARISPYEFDYNYKGSTYYRTVADVPLSGTGEEYADIVEFADDLTTQQQNPGYSPFNIDRWGNYQKDGHLRFNKYNFWVNQKEQTGFDPAAWQLKCIKLPSGGEIHVQYEQNEYRHVQHRPAMIMVPLSTGNKPESKFSIDLDGALTMPTDGTQYEAVVGDVMKRMREYFLTGANGMEPEHIFFRFLYALEGNNASLDLCSSEFISGHAKVRSIWTEGTGTAKKIWMEIGDPQKEYTIPDRVCENFVRTNRAGIISQDNCSASASGVPWGDIDAYFLTVTGRILELLFLGWGDYYDSDNNCKVINYPDSYFRIPLPDSHPKKGGGVRVKRLLMVDPGVEGSEDAALYGTEYLYETPEGLCSGVATNEPNVGREENSLITVLNKREAQNGYERTFAGEDRDQFEGPIGESIMPAASVGYSRVVARNIYPGKATTGYTINEFYTAYDYPFDLTYATVGSVNGLGTQKTDIQKPFDIRFNVSVTLVSQATTNIRRTQGFRFIINSMHGKPKSVSTHAGHFLTRSERIAQQAEAWTPSHPVESVLYEYFEPGEPIPVMRGSSMGDRYFAHPGKEMEVVLESRLVRELTNDGSLQIDFGIGALGLFPLPFFSNKVGVGFGNTKHQLATHVTTKVIKYPVIQKRVIAFKDGATDTTEYLAFNPESGSPVLVRSSDGYNQLSLSAGPLHDGSYYSHSIPSSWNYPQLGQKAVSERMVLRSNSQDDETGFIMDKRYLKDGDEELHYLTLRFTEPGADSRVFDILSPGDLVLLSIGQGESPTELGVYHIGRIAGSRIELLPTSISLRDTQVELPSVNIEIIQSGRSNNVSSTAGQFTTYGLPPQITNHPWQ